MRSTLVIAWNCAGHTWSPFLARFWGQLSPGPGSAEVALGVLGTFVPSRLRFAYPRGAAQTGCPVQSEFKAHLGGCAFNFQSGFFFCSLSELSLLRFIEKLLSCVGGQQDVVAMFLFLSFALMGMEKTQVLSENPGGCECGER